MAECRSCGSSVRWVVTLTGKRMPLDRDPSPDGNVRPVVRNGSDVRAQVLGSDDAALAREQGEQLWRSHFATCPQADAHRSTSSSTSS